MPTSMLSAKEVTMDLLIRYGFQLLGALVVLVAGALLARWVGNATGKWLETRRMEPPVRTLIVRVVRVVVMVFTLVVALDKFGFQIAPLVAGIGVAGLGIGIALQGVLSNVVAGLSIIFTKPFRVGEYIALLGVQGEVSADRAVLDDPRPSRSLPGRDPQPEDRGRDPAQLRRGPPARPQRAGRIRVGPRPGARDGPRGGRWQCPRAPGPSAGHRRGRARRGGPHRERGPMGGGDGLYPRAGRALPGAGGSVADPAHRAGGLCARSGWSRGRDRREPARRRGGVECPERYHGLLVAAPDAARRPPRPSHRMPVGDRGVPTRFGDWGAGHHGQPARPVPLHRAHRGGAAHPDDVRALRRPGHAPQRVPRIRGEARIQCRRRRALVRRGGARLSRGDAGRRPGEGAVPGAGGHDRLAREGHALRHRRGRGRRPPARGRARRAGHVDGRGGRRPGRDAAHRQARRDQCPLVQCAPRHELSRAGGGPARCDLGSDGRARRARASIASGTRRPARATT